MCLTKHQFIYNRYENETDNFGRDDADDTDGM